MDRRLLPGAGEDRLLRPAAPGEAATPRGGRRPPEAGPYGVCAFSNATLRWFSQVSPADNVTFHAGMKQWDWKRAG